MKKRNNATKKNKEDLLKRKKYVIYAKWFSTDDNEKYHKVGDHYHCTRKYRGTAHDIFNLRHKTLNKISVVFLNGPTYDYHFIIKELAKEFEVQFECLGENTVK